MTHLLEKAFAEAAKLPPSDQDAIAKLLLAELADDRRWENAFASSQDALAQLANEALAEDESGRTQPLDPDRL